MQGLEQIKIIRKYCDYVEEHLLNVQKAWGILKEALKGENVIYDDHLFFNIDGQIKDHDLSKMMSAEFMPYANWFFGDHGKEWESMDVDHEAEHICLKEDFNRAWDHHKKYNPHHWQSACPELVRFPNQNACHIVCMVADWMAMGMKFGDTAEEYYDTNKEKIDLPEWAVTFLELIFEKLRDLPKTDITKEASKQ